MELRQSKTRFVVRKEKVEEQFILSVKQKGLITQHGSVWCWKDLPVRVVTTLFKNKINKIKEFRCCSDALMQKKSLGLSLICRGKKNNYGSLGPRKVAKKWRDWILLWLLKWLLFSPPARCISILGQYCLLNCTLTVAGGGWKGSVLTAQLYGGDIDISVSVMPPKHRDHNPWTHTSETLSVSFIGGM